MMITTSTTSTTTTISTTTTASLHDSNNLYEQFQHQNQLYHQHTGNSPCPYPYFAYNKTFNSSTSTTSLSMDRAAFLLIRIKRVFQKKRRKLSQQSSVIRNDGASCKMAGNKKSKFKPPMLRARTLPSIITPALNILGAQLQANHKVNADGDVVIAASYCDFNPILNETLCSHRNMEFSPMGKSEVNCNCTSCAVLSSSSPRHSVSSNSSASSKEFSNKTKNSLQKFAKLLGNNSNRILNPASHCGNFWPNLYYGQAFFNQDGRNSGGWNFLKNELTLNKKRFGSIDSLLSTSTITDHHSSNGQWPDSTGPGTGYDIQQQSQKAHFPYLMDNVTITQQSNILPGPLYLPTTKFSPQFKIKAYHPTQQHYLSVPYAGERQLSIDVGSSDCLIDASNRLKKGDRKKLEKLSKFNFDQQALFSAVENEHLERTRTILESTDVDVNCISSDGFTPLDISVMLVNVPLIKYLQSFGAHESNQFTTSLSRQIHLQSLLNEAESCLFDISACLHRQSNQSNIGGIGSTSQANLSSALIKEKERQLIFWKRRVKLLQRFKQGLDILEPPPPPLSVHVQIAGPQSLLVHYYPAIQFQNQPNIIIITKYKIEWSMDQFESIVDSEEITNLSAKREFIIERLESEQNYQIRVASGNCKGYSEFCYPLMNQFIPSTWRSIDNKYSSLDSKRYQQIDQLFLQIIDWRQKQLLDNNNKRKSVELEQLSLMISNGGSLVHHQIGIAAAGNCSSNVSQKKVRKSIKSFFGGANKFQKIMKPSGIYFASLIYHEPRILVTNEEVLPLIEIDDQYPSTLQNDFYWLLKISCNWDDVKLLRKELEKSLSSTVAHFRSKILIAIEQMQTSLGLKDLGKLYYKPLRDNEGTVVFCTIRCLIEPKVISCLSVRWLPLTKLQRRIQSQRDKSSLEKSSDSSANTFLIEIDLQSTKLINEIIITAFDEMIQYYRACNNQLSRGLYIGYVKLKSTVDLMSLMVDKNHPNILPYAKIRDNPHISRQEWTALKICLGSERNSANKRNTSDNETNTLQYLINSGSSINLSNFNGEKEKRRKSPEQLNIPSQIDFGSMSPLVSPIIQSGPGFIENFFQLACQNKQVDEFESNEIEKPLPLNSNERMAQLTTEQKLNFQQLVKFLNLLTHTSDNFLQSIGITDEERLNSHRIYTVEVIELNSQVSFILLLPPGDELFSVTQQIESNCSNSNFGYLPLKIFELIHLNTYQWRFTKQYWRISALLEMDITAAQHAQREAFSGDEVIEAKTRLNRLLEFQTQLDEHCRSMRWIMDVVSYARDRQISPGISLNGLKQYLNLVDKMKVEKNCFGWSTVPQSIFPGTNTYFVPKINIQCESNSTPSSPPPVTLNLTMCRRKSRDDSYLDQHHRAQNQLHNQLYNYHNNEFIQQPLMPQEKEMSQIKSAAIPSCQDFSSCLCRQSESSLLNADVALLSSNNLQHANLSTDVVNMQEQRRCLSESKLLSPELDRFSPFTNSSEINSDDNVSSTSILKDCLPVISSQTNEMNEKSLKIQTKIEELFFKDNFEDILQNSTLKLKETPIKAKCINEYNNKMKNQQSEQERMNSQVSVIGIQQKIQKQYTCCSECCDLSSCSCSSNSSDCTTINTCGSDLQNSDIAPSYQNVHSQKISVYVIKDCCLTRGCLVDLRVTFGSHVVDIIRTILQYAYSIKNKSSKSSKRRSKINKDKRYDDRFYSLLVIYSSNVKHLNKNFQIEHLQSPWNVGQLCLEYKN